MTRKVMETCIAILVAKDNEYRRPSFPAVFEIEQMLDEMM